MSINDELLYAVTGQMTPARGAALADDAVLAWERILRKFGPLIGVNSTELLLERSMEGAGLARLPSASAGHGTALVRLHASLAARPPEDIIAAQRAMLTMFIEMVSTLIGARLTVQFLRAAFPAAPTDSSTEEKPDDR